MLNLILGLAVLVLVVWLSIGLWRAAKAGEIQLFWTSDGGKPGRRSQPIIFWAAVVWIVFMVLGLSTVAVQLLLGVDLRWWL